MDDKILALALSRGMESFKIHADQRMKLMNFYIVIFLALLAGFSAVAKEKNYILEILVSILVIIFTYAFRNLDRRSSVLLKDSEALLTEIEGELRKRTGFESLDLIKASENKRGVPSYRISFLWMHLTGYVVGLACLMYSFISRL